MVFHRPRFKRYAVAHPGFRVRLNRYGLQIIGVAVVVGKWAYSLKWAWAGRHLVITAALVLTGCGTSVNVAYEDGAGKTVSASYWSLTDKESPSFRMIRDAAGQIQSIEMSAGSSLVSPVIAGQAAFAQGMAAGIAEGLMRGLKSSATGLPMGVP